MRHTAVLGTKLGATRLILLLLRRLRLYLTLIWRAAQRLIGDYFRP